MDDKPEKIKKIRRYDFRIPNPDDARSYCFFGDLEDNDDVFFHGTSEKAFHLIVEEGFRTGSTVFSVSFARSSSFALPHACKFRSEASPNGCIIAVRYEDLKPG